MSTRGFGGAFGKARLVRVRARAADWYTDQWIDEEIRPSEGSRMPPPRIRAGGAAEFHASVMADLGTVAAAGAQGEQLALPLQTGGRTERRTGTVQETKDRRPRTKDMSDPFAIAASADSASASIDAKDRKLKGYNYLKPLPGLKRLSRPFSWAGFVSGCAIGGVAAAVILALVYIVAG